MARRLRYLILIAMIAVVGVGVAFLVVRSHLLSSPEMLLSEVLSNVDLSLQNIDYTQITDGKKEWTLRATQVDFQKDKDLFSLRDIHVILYREDGSEINLKGKLGYYNRGQNWVKVEGGVVAESDDGYRFTGESFNFDIESKILTSQQAVHISGPGFKINGQGLKVDIAAWTVTLLRDVETELARIGEKSGA